MAPLEMPGHHNEVLSESSTIPPSSKNVQPSPLNRFKVFYDQAQDLLLKEKESTVELVDSFLDTIVQEGEAISPEEIEGITELDIAQQISDATTHANEVRRNETRMRSVPHLKYELQQEQLRLPKKQRRKKIRKLEQKIQEYSATEITDDSFSQDRESDFSNLERLNATKLKILKRGMSLRLKGKGSRELRNMIKEIVLTACQERKNLGLPPYTRDEILMLVYEMVYGDYLWRNERRKDGKTSYFRSHLRAAMLNNIRHGFTGLVSLLVAMKHDDLEDLAIHRAGCWKIRLVDGQPKKNYDVEYKSSWLFCSDLYLDQFTPDADIPENQRSPLKELRGVKATVEGTVKDLTSPPLERLLPTNPDDKLSQDEAKARKYLENLVKNGYAAAAKVLEQPHNASTIRSLEPARQGEKLETILILYGLMAKVIELQGAEQEILAAGIDFYRPELRPWFNAMQQKRMREHLGLTPELNDDERKNLLSQILRPKASIKRPDLAYKKLGRLLERLFLSSSLSRPGINVSAVQNKIRMSIDRLFSPIDLHILSIEVLPMPLERYLEVHALLKDPAYYPTIFPDDPMFEILVTVREAEQIWPVACEIMRFITPDGEFGGNMGKPPQERPQRGLTLELNRDDFGGKVVFRINGAREEALAKRGLRVNREKPVPNWLVERVRRTLIEARHSGRPLLEVAEECLLRKTIPVKTDEDRPRVIYLPEGATYRDFAAKLPGGDIGMFHLFFGVRAHRRIGDRIESRTMDDVVYPGEKCHVYIDGQIVNEDGKHHKIVRGGKVQMDLGQLLSFTQDDHTIHVARRFWKQEILAEGKRGEFETRKAAIQRATDYLSRLSSIFAIKNPEMIPLISMNVLELYPSQLSGFLDASVKTAHQKYSYQKEKTLFEIGNAGFDPLKALSRHVDLSQPCSLKLIVPDEPGVMGDIGLEAKAYGINLTQGNSLPSESNGDSPLVELNYGLTLPAGMKPYELLKFVLKLSYKYRTYFDSNIFNFDQNPELTEQLDLIKRLHET